MNTHYLTLTWSTSRGRDTYGYNLLKLSSGYRGQVFRTCGGGYDMTGTVVGQWLQANYAERLLALKGRTHAIRTADGRYTHKTDDGKVNGRNVGIYGATYHEAIPAKGRAKAQAEYVSLDGACGISCMQDIAKAIGLSFTATVNRRGHVTGYMVTDYGSAEALVKAQAVQP